MKRSNGFYYCALIMITQSIIAGSTAVNGVGAKGTAMQAFTAVADDLSAIYYNPAGLLQLKKDQVKGGVNLLYPDLNYTNSRNGITTRSSRSAIGANLFYGHVVNDRWRVGVGLYSPFARISRYAENAAVASPLGSAPQSGYFVRMDLVPTAAYALTDQFSIGLSGVLSYGRAQSNIWGLDEKSSGLGVTAQVGVLWRLASQLRLGIDYRAPERMKTTGNGSSTPGVYPGIPVNGAYSATVNYPGTVSVGLAWQVANPWLFSLEYNNEMWSTLKNITRIYSNTTVINPVNAKNSSNYRIGTAFTLNTTNQLYLGYSDIAKAVPQMNITPAQPDFNINIMALGYSYLRQHWRFDLTYEYSHFNQRLSNGPAFPGTYQGHLQHILLDITYV